ncbi:ABC transporter permease subunit [Cytobacillus spongiae]|uniref:ABC transporter permease n=1 Tax=Cytobacillus spongiae TaxID=2901381 RepID=UPI001F377856|nr:ABC transporter permease subunit [Cytobacillus spongiae]UII54149.1 ABC transporter permease subunit [Cytobacillus spongiae]
MKWSKRSKISFALFPAIFFVLLLVGYGLLSAFLTSIQGDGSWTLTYYKEILKDPTFLDSIQLSLTIASVSTTLSLLIGLLVAKWMFESLKSHHSKALIWIPMLFPHFVWAYVMLLLLSQTGWVSAIFETIGWIDDYSDFPLWIRDHHGIGMILTYIGKEVPFVVLMVLPVYVQMNPNYPLVVQTLGGSKWRVFKDIEWPFLYPVVAEAGLIIFAFVLGAYEVPYLLGTTYPKYVSVLTYDWFYEGDWSQRPYAFAVMILLTLVIMLPVVLYYIWHLHNRKRFVKGEVDR